MESKMSQPDLFRLTIQARLHEMRAYIMEAFNPKKIEPLLDLALKDAEYMLPLELKIQIEQGVKDAVKVAVHNAFRSITYDENLQKSIKENVIRAIGKAMLEIK